MREPIASEVSDMFASQAVLVEPSVAVAHVSHWVSLLDPLFLGSRVEVVIPWEGCVTLLDPCSWAAAWR